MPNVGPLDCTVGVRPRIGLGPFPAAALSLRVTRFVWLSPGYSRSASAAALPPAAAGAPPPEGLDAEGSVGALPMR